MKKILMIAAILMCASLIRPDNASALKYRIEIDIALHNEQDAIDLLNYIEDIKTKTYKPRGNEKIPVYRKTRYHECSHEEENPVRCKDYINIEFDKEKKVHKIKEGR